MAGSGDVGSWRAFTEHLRDGVSGDEVNQQKHEAHDKPDDGQGVEDALGKAREHQLSAALSSTNECHPERRTSCDRMKRAPHRFTSLPLWRLRLDLLPLWFSRFFPWRDIEFVFNVAHQLLEDVLDGDYAGGRSKFIHHNGQMAAAVFEFGEQLGQNFSFGDDQHVMHDLADLHAGNTG